MPEPKRPEDMPLPAWWHNTLQVFGPVLGGIEPADVAGNLAAFAELTPEEREGYACILQFRTLYALAEQERLLKRIGIEVARQSGRTRAFLRPLLEPPPAGGGDVRGEDEEEPPDDADRGGGGSATAGDEEPPDDAPADGGGGGGGPMAGERPDEPFDPDEEERAHAAELARLRNAERGDRPPADRPRGGNAATPRRRK